MGIGGKNRLPQSMLDRHFPTEALGGTLTLAQPVLGTGQVVIGANSTLQLAGEVPASETVKFSGRTTTPVGAR